ncbi:MAG: NAD(+)/NADH kinase, partial [Rikenellaceae bacterium]
MKFAIYTKGERYFPKEDLVNLIDLSNECGFDMTFNKNFAEYSAENYDIVLESYNNSADIDADFVLSFGGDGTFLHCVAMLEARDIPILG